MKLVVTLFSAPGQILMRCSLVLVLKEYGNFLRRHANTRHALFSSMKLIVYFPDQDVEVKNTVQAGPQSTKC